MDIDMDIALDLDIGDIIVKTAIGVLPHLDKSDKERDPITYTATDPDPDLEIKDIPDLVEKRIAQIPQTRSTTTLSHGLGGRNMIQEIEVEELAQKSVQSTVTDPNIVGSPHISTLTK
ncbi:hypothetical protein CFE70_003274 [Pyrenophora teres f. teres 0-1]